MSNFMFENVLISDVLFAYLNIVGIAVFASFLVCAGLRLFLDNKRYLTIKRVTGLALLLSAALYLLRSLVLAFCK